MSYAHTSQYDQTCAYEVLFILDICMLRTFTLSLFKSFRAIQEIMIGFSLKELIPR